jgi:hypothetical protein
MNGELAALAQVGNNTVRGIATTGRRSAVPVRG